MSNLPPCPPSLKSIQHYLTLAKEHDARDVVVSYWCRLYALQEGIKVDKSSPEARQLLGALMGWLETTKETNKDNEAIIHDIPAQAHLENYALKLFLHADQQDRAGIFNKNVVKTFFTSSLIYSLLESFGELTEEVIKNQKYAKWKATYINNCLKNGETPIAGPVDDGENDDLENELNALPPGSSGNITDPTSNSNAFSAGTSFDAGISSGGGVAHPGYPTAGFTQPSARPPFPSVTEPFPPAVAPLPMNIPTEPSVAIEPSNDGVQANPEVITKAQKYCKFATSALNYDDIPTAVVNLQKALSLLTTGRES